MSVLTEVVRVRMSAEELRQLRALAGRNNRTISNQARAAILESFKRQDRARRDGQDVMAGLERANASQIESVVDAAPRVEAELVESR